MVKQQMKEKAKTKAKAEKAEKAGIAVPSWKPMPLTSNLGAIQIRLLLSR